MNEQEFENLRGIVFETGEIPEKYYCGECGCVKVTLDQSFKLEALFYYNRSNPPSGPVFVEVCGCDEEVVE